MYVDTNRDTTQKNRIFLNNKLNVRFDIEQTNDIPIDIENDIIAYVLLKQHVFINNYYYLNNIII